jgi:hypothetical protein
MNSPPAHAREWLGTSAAWVCAAAITLEALGTPMMIPVALAVTAATLGAAAVLGRP